MCELFCAHEKGFASDIVPSTRLLLDSFAALQQAGLTLNLVSKGAPHTADRVHIFDLNFCSEFGLLFRSHRHVTVAAELPLLHVGVAYAAVDQDLFQRRQKRERLFRRINLRLRHDLHQRRAGAIEINPSTVLEMETFRHVFLEMDPHQMHFLVAGCDIFLGVFRISQVVQRHAAIRAKRHVVLRNLIVFRHVGIEIVFAVEFADRRDVASQHEPG